jgi:hypothetical protein
MRLPPAAAWNGFNARPARLSAVRRGRQGGYHSRMTLAKSLRRAALACAPLALAASFGAGKEVARLPAELREISGMAVSRANPGVFWVHNDSGDQPRVYAVNAAGRLLGTFALAGASAVDWEDMAIGPAPDGGSYLYLADIGDNNAQRASVQVYRVAEPRLAADQAPVVAILDGVTAFDFVYEDGARDAEGFFVDPLNGNFYVVSKREQNNRLYRAVAPRAGQRNTLMRAGAFQFTLSTGADISADGMQVLIRRYSLTAVDAARAATYWRRPDASVSLEELLSRPGEIVPLAQEPQGEAIAFAPDGRGFYTTTERVELTQAPLVYYAAQ